MSLMDIATFRVTGEMIVWWVFMPAAVIAGICVLAGALRALGERMPAPKPAPVPPFRWVSTVPFGLLILWMLGAWIWQWLGWA